jgi:hypothetical protein
MAVHTRCGQVRDLEVEEVVKKRRKMEMVGRVKVEGKGMDGRNFRGG